MDHKDQDKKENKINFDDDKTLEKEGKNKNDKTQKENTEKKNKEIKEKYSMEDDNDYE